MSYGGPYGGPAVNGIPRTPSGRYGYGPSRYLLRNTVDLYKRVKVKDKDRATVPTYQLYQTAVRCTVQPMDTRSRYDEGGEAIIQFIPYFVGFAINPDLTEFDKITWMDSAGRDHEIIVIGTRDQAGIGVFFVIDGEERM